MRFSLPAAAAVVAAGAFLAVPAVAGAHVTVHPNAVPAGGETVLNINVPNEEAKASTTEVQVQLPPGFVAASPTVIPGWTTKTTTSKLATPITTDDGPIDTEVDTVTWTATGAGLPAGSFMLLPLSVAIPDAAGKDLTFKAVQTYSSGEVVRWIGSPTAEAPAPRIAVTAKDQPVADYPAGPPAPGAAPSGPGSSTTAAPASAPVPAAASNSDDHTLSVIALVVGALGLVAGGVALVRSRRGRPAAGTA